MDIALGEEKIVRRLSIYMGDAKAVSINFYRGVQTGKGDLSIRVWVRVGGQINSKSKNSNTQDKEYTTYDREELA